MNHMTLVILAAGIGSRFGGGIKQLEPVGPNGEIIMDYSIRDALAAGFNKVVFIIRRDIEKDFREVIGNRIEKLVEVAYVFQELDDLPQGFSKPEDRVKPWGTGHALLCCRGVVNEPFAVLNADDYYGKEAFKNIYDYMTSARPAIDQFDFCMAGFILRNTLSNNGGVTRGICRVDENNHIIRIRETKNIVKVPEGSAVFAADGTKHVIPPETHVSMNMWGLTPDFLDMLADGFREFLFAVPEGDLKAEYLLPSIIDDLIQTGRAQVTMLETKDKWFGVTYKEDKEGVVNAIKELIKQGLY